MSENKINFEKNLNELEQIISKLENGNCSLEESLSLFEKGMEHTDACRKALENAKAKITTFTESKGVE